jgi:hypothetical protein
MSKRKPDGAALYYGTAEDARLLAAAPDQHAALIESADAIESAYESIYEALPDGPVPDWFVRLEAAAKQARAAINKATGAA